MKSYTKPPQPGKLRPLGVVSLDVLRDRYTDLAVRRPELLPLAMAMLGAVVPSTMPSYWCCWSTWQRVIDGLLDQQVERDTASDYLMVLYQFRAMRGEARS